MLFDDIEVFLSIAETKSMSQAAERLYISRQGLSQKIAGIEMRYGAKLYERTTAGIVPTPAGELVTKFARSVSAMGETLSAEIAALDESFESTIRVGMSLADGEMLLPLMTKRFMDDFPGARIHLDAGYEFELVDKLKQGKLDFAIVENQLIEDGLSRETLGYEQLVFLAPDKSPYNCAMQPVSVATLLKWPAVTYEWDSGFHLTGNRHFRERYGITLNDHNRIVQFDTHEARINGIKAGLGWGSVPRCIAERHKGEPGLIRFRVDTAPLRYPVDLVWITDRALSSEASAFKEFIRNNVPEGFFVREKS